MNQFLSWVGAFFVIAAAAGVFIPGVAFHAYLGSSEGALKWHKDAVAKGVARKEAGQ